MKSLIERFWLVTVLAIGIMGLPAQANATLVLNLDGYTGAPSGGTTCVDNTSCDKSPEANVITFVGGLGKWLVNVQVGVSNAPATDEIDRLHLTSSLMATGAETLELTLTDLFSPTGAGDLVFSSQGNGAGIPAGSTLVGNGAKVNEQFVPYVTTPDCSYSLAAPPTGGNFPGCIETAAHDAIASYFMVLSQTIHVTGATGFFSIDSTLTNSSGEGTTEVPEPAALGLFGMGLTGVGMAIRRRKRQQAARSDS